MNRTVEENSVRCCSAVAMAFSMHWANDWALRTGSSMSGLLSTLPPLCTEVGRHPRSFRKRNEIKKSRNRNLRKPGSHTMFQSSSELHSSTFRFCVLWQRERQDVRSQRVNRRPHLDLRCLQSNSLPESASVDFGFDIQTRILQGCFSLTLIWQIMTVVSVVLHQGTCHGCRASVFWHRSRCLACRLRFDRREELGISIRSTHLLCCGVVSEQKQVSNWTDIEQYEA